MSKGRYQNIIDHNRKQMQVLSARKRKLKFKLDLILIEHRELKELNKGLIEIQKKDLRKWVMKLLN